ncbi:hypothetical protein AALO_G00255590 [Alosa alosa]|uniref:C-type lectin domain-containing protein n=1 Tax=Alosa alosa TaxID=278164 RepID=A0AAV6FPZ1_9TELE|nr:hypothetical protein AALO_G00255590 [Alosa alosa]
MHHNFASSRTHQHQTNEELQTAEELCCYHGTRSNVKLVLPVLISGLLLLTVVITARVVDSSTEHQSGKCEHDWEPHGKQCYFFSKRALNWSQSLEECTRMRSHLVIIDNEDEQIFLMGEIKQKMQHAEDKFWIGLNDI